MISEPKPRLHRPCIICGKRFQPYGRSNKICNECRDDIAHRTKKKAKEMARKKREEKNARKL